MSRGRRALGSAADQTGDDVVEDGPDDGLLADAADVRTLGGVGALLAACLVLFIGARRTRQQSRRRPGERLPVPPPSVLATEARLRSVADPAGVSHIDLAPASARRRAPALGRPLPGLRYARLTRTHLELCLAAPRHCRRPWIPTSDPTVWAMTHEELTGQVETDMRSPYPALVTIGHDLEDAHVLVDLEHAGALAIEGQAGDTLPVLAGAAVELATSPWADDLLVTLVGCLPELPARVTTGRLRHVDRLEQLIAELEGRAADIERVLRDAGVQDLATARGTGVADDAWSPEIVLLADEITPALRERLENVLHRVPRVGVAAMTAGASLGEWRLRLDAAGGLARLEPVGLTLRPQRIAGSEYEDVLELLDNADAAPVGGPGWASGLPSLEQALADLPGPATDSGDPRDEQHGEDLSTATSGHSQSPEGFDVTDLADEHHRPRS